MIRSLGARLVMIWLLGIVGVILVIAALQAHDPVLERRLFVAGVVAGAASIALMLWLARRHTTRIRELEQHALRMAGGDAGAGVREHSGDELGRLGRAINRMASEGRSRFEALEQERDERDRILAHMRDGVALIDESGRILRMNRSLADLLGAPLPAVTGTPFREYIRSPELDGLIRSARDERRTVEADLRLWTQGQPLVHATATPVGGGRQEHVLLVLHDLSQAERLNQVRQDFVANVSHELRTPLTSLRGYAETLLEWGLDDPVHRIEFVRTIRDQAMRLENLTEDLLSLAELERPDAERRFEAFDLREAVQRLVSTFRARAEQQGLTLALIPGPALPVEADRVRIEQVLANLLDNAIKYTERGGVRVALGGDDALVWCEVADTGPGVPEADQPRIFERFYRVDKARSREKGGTGLGLSIVKHIVTLHGGEVSVRSRPGEGSVFRFEIPRHQTTTEAP